MSRGKTLELLRPDETGKVQTIFTTEVFGCIRALAPFRLTGASRDYIIVGSDSGRIVIVEYVKEANHFKKIHQETFGKSGCRRIVPGQYLAVDPKGRACMIGKASSSPAQWHTVLRALLHAKQQQYWCPYSHSASYRPTSAQGVHDSEHITSHAQFATHSKRLLERANDEVQGTEPCLSHACASAMKGFLLCSGRRGGEAEAGVRPEQGPGGEPDHILPAGRAQVPQHRLLHRRPGHGL